MLGGGSPVTRGENSKRTFEGSEVFAVARKEQVLSWEGRQATISRNYYLSVCTGHCGGAAELSRHP